MTFHGQDIASFDLSSTHRLPTVSAAQAYEDLNDDSSRFVSTSLEALDGFLATGAVQSGADAILRGGIQKGQVTEIWGPPGVGKSTFGIQLVANALRTGNKAVWVDAFHPVCYPRLTAVTGLNLDGGDSSLSNGLAHFTCPSLPHFIALLCRPSPTSLPEGTALVVVDALSALLNQAFPKSVEHKPLAKGNGGGRSASARRAHALQYISAALQKLAATRNVAVVVLTQCATRFRAEQGVTLISAVNSGAWDQGVSTRLVLFRDWVWKDSRAISVRLAGVQKLNGKPVSLPDNVVAFDIDSKGLTAVQLDGNHLSVGLSSTPALKRKLAETDFEVPNSEDEDYGWQDEDDLPEMPPQWQGSEDILLGRRPGSDDGEAEAEDEPSTDGDADSSDRGANDD